MMWTWRKGRGWSDDHGDNADDDGDDGDDDSDGDYETKAQPIMRR